MREFDTEKAVTMVARLMQERQEDTLTLAREIVDVMAKDFLEPAVDFWKRRLGSEIQNLQLRESLLSCHLRMYIARFGTPDLRTLVLGTTESGEKD